MSIGMCEKENKPLISVAVITYNQQDTIAQTLDSILMQKGDFNLELVIGEDCSTDNTWNICQDYAARYPDIVRLLPNTHNLGIMGNYARTVLACSGEFVGEIAGDDYYYDDHALEKQMSFLQQYPDFGFMTVNGYRYYVRRNKLVLGLAPAHPYTDGNVKPFYFSEHYSGGVYATPVGVMFRRSLLKHVDFNEIGKQLLSNMTDNICFPNRFFLACIPIPQQKYYYYIYKYQCIYLLYLYSFVLHFSFKLQLLTSNVFEITFDNSSSSVILVYLFCIIESVISYSLFVHNTSYQTPVS